MEYTGLGIANFALILLYPNTQHWKGKPDNELEDPIHHFPMALTTTEAQEIEIIWSLIIHYSCFFIIYMVSFFFMFVHLNHVRAAS